MYVDIHSRDASDSTQDRSKPGKSMWVNEPGFEMKLCRTEASHLGNPPWYVEIKGETTEERITENSYRATWRELKLQLTPADFDKLLTFALQHGLIELKAKPSSP
jgi:hypothetical protein